MASARRSLEAREAQPGHARVAPTYCAQIPPRPSACPTQASPYHDALHNPGRPRSSLRWNAPELPAVPRGPNRVPVTRKYKPGARENPIQRRPEKLVRAAGRVIARCNAGRYGGATRSGSDATPGEPSVCRGDVDAALPRRPSTDASVRARALPTAGRARGPASLLPGLRRRWIERRCETPEAAKRFSRSVGRPRTNLSGAVRPATRARALFMPFASARACPVYAPPPHTSYVLRAMGCGEAVTVAGSFRLDGSSTGSRSNVVDSWTVIRTCSRLPHRTYGGTHPIDYTQRVLPQTPPPPPPPPPPRPTPPTSVVRRKCPSEALSIKPQD
ncbi:hypothetical protein OBBRIDRAFT_39677 [Obba rivulosa]|uniref:Uncharacterized protein n=1 Tax=Obba rivulosa TaxID=1052685 RepID=A0A8E2ATN9_9APHY|nr:hypothetical protein OBBRIDRAFT_39677 [Obba rivulosa]